jgi:hypothetical protein
MLYGLSFLCHVLTEGLCVCVGDKFKGQLNSSGKRHGLCLFVCFVMSWFHRAWTGTGVYTMKNGTVYRGSFKQGKPHGFGEYKYPNGDVYIGEVAPSSFS